MDVMRRKLQLYNIVRNNLVAICIECQFNTVDKTTNCIKNESHVSSLITMTLAGVMRLQNLLKL